MVGFIFPVPSPSDNHARTVHCQQTRYPRPRRRFNRPQHGNACIPLHLLSPLSLLSHHVSFSRLRSIFVQPFHHHSGLLDLTPPAALLHLTSQAGVARRVSLLRSRPALQADQLSKSLLRLGEVHEIDRPWTLPCPFFCSLCGHFWPAAEHARFYYCHMFLSIAFNLTVSSLSLFPSLSPPSLSHNALRHRHSPQMRLQNSRRRGGRPCSHQPLFVEARRLQVSCSGHSRRHVPHSSRRRRRRPDSVRSRNPPLPNSHQGHRPPNFLAPRRLLPREVLPVPF